MSQLSGRLLEFDVAGRRLAVSSLFWDPLHGPKPEPGFACDGCSLSPDKLGRFKLWPACVIHDYHYRLAPVSRLEADAALYWNLHGLVRMQGGGRAKARAIAWLYWGRVRIWGAKAYKGEGSKGLLARIREVWS